MRAVIRTNESKIEFSGRGQLWNELLRPHLGGPEAPSEERKPAAPPSAPSPALSSAAARGPSSPAAAPVQLTPHRTDPQAASAVPRPTPAPDRSAHAAQPQPVAAAAQPRTWYPPREQAPKRFEPVKSAPQDYYSAEEDEGDSVRVEPSSDPATLYGRLAALPGRRSERDAVLAAMWFLTKGEREATGDEVEHNLETFRAFPDVKVLPHLLKHVHRTKMLEFGSSQRAVRLSKKGLAYVHARLVGE